VEPTYICPDCGVGMADVAGTCGDCGADLVPIEEVGGEKDAAYSQEELETADDDFATDQMDEDLEPQTSDY